MSEAPPKKEGVDWLEVGKVFAMPVVTLLLGALINMGLNSRQERDARVKLYADIMGRREQADSDLRKDMFQSILTTFLTKDPKEPRAQYLDTEVLNIELLAYNFDESLDLGPLFKYVRRNLAPSSDGKSNDILQARLEEVAEEVKVRQLAILSDSGMVAEGDLDSGAQNLEDALGFGKETVLPQKGEKRGGPILCLALMSTDGVTHYRQFKIRYLDYSQKSREAELNLMVSRPLIKEDCYRILAPEVENANAEAETEFYVGLFSFPMIDNIHLSHSERCSVSLSQISDDDAPRMKLRVSYFQASRASLKDKIYYDEVLHDLLGEPQAH